MSKKTVIILGEEHWFKYKEGNLKLIGMEHLKEKIKSKNKDINLIILESPRNIMDTINKYENVVGVFLFHDVFSDSFVDKKSIFEMKQFFKKLEEKIYLYPGVEKTMLFGSKKYYKTLINEMPYAALPYSDILEVKNYQGIKDEGKIKYLLIKKMKKMFEKFDTVVVKKGFSYESLQVKVFHKKDLLNKGKLKYKLDSLNYKYFFKVSGDAKKWEQNIDRYYIIQGYNKIVRKKTNEFRVFFFNGKMKYISWGDEYTNLCVKDEENYIYSRDDIDDIGDLSSISDSNDSNNITDYKGIDDNAINNLNNINKNLMKEILKFSKKVYQDFKPKFWSNKLEFSDPILFRIDVSFAIDDIFQDQYSINVDGFEKKIRLYVNELEIDPTNFFYNYTLCKKDNKITSQYLEEKMAENINKHIDKLK